MFSNFWVVGSNLGNGHFQMLCNLFIKKLFSNKYNVIPYNLGIILTGFFSRIRFCKFRVTIRRVMSVFDLFYDVLLQF